MRYIILFISTISILFFSCCSRNINNNYSGDQTSLYQEPKTYVYETTSEIPSEETSSSEVITEQQKEFITEDVTYSSDGIPIENAYFSFYLPSSWNEKYISDISFDENSTMIMNFKEKNSAEQNDSGLIFSLALAPYPETIQNEGSKKLYSVYSSDGLYSLYLIIPPQAEYTTESESMFNTMSSDIDTILQSLTAANGCTFE